MNMKGCLKFNYTNGLIKEIHHWSVYGFRVHDVDSLWLLKLADKKGDTLRPKCVYRKWKVESLRLKCANLVSVPNNRRPLGWSSLRVLSVQLLPLVPQLPNPSPSLHLSFPFGPTTPFFTCSISPVSPLHLLFQSSHSHHPSPSLPLSPSHCLFYFSLKENIGDADKCNGRLAWSPL